MPAFTPESHSASVASVKSKRNIRMPQASQKVTKPVQEVSDDTNIADGVQVGGGGVQVG